MQPIRIYTDGASRGNPGDAAIGVVILEGDTVLAELRECIGTQTNNWAEYEAVVQALLKAGELGLVERTIRMHMDSKLVAEQLSGNWKIKEPALKEQHARAMHIVEDGGFKDVSYTYIPRAQNAHADRLANEALDSA